MATNRPEWYGIFANNPELFQNCLVALKQVDFNQDFKEHKVEAAYSNADPDTKKHVRLLDGLALLFVWARAGDVCATTFVRDNDSATIYWAKNNPSPPTLAQQTYLTELLNHFPAQKSQSEILQACMRVCRTKMITRCQKAGNQFILSPQRQNHLGVNMREPFNQDLLVRLRNARVCGQNTSLITTLDWFVTTLKDINSSIPANQLQGLLIAAYLIVPQQEEATESPILTRLQLRQVRKVAAYLAVIKRVLLTCKNHNLKSLKEKQVSTPGQDLVKVFSHTVNAMNQVVPYIHNMPNVQYFNQVKNHYDSAVSGDRPARDYLMLTSQHCELTLALEMLKNPYGQRIIKIGCSKASCYWCHLYLENLNEHLTSSDPATNMQVVHYATHGKRTTGWKMPEASGDVGDQVYLSIGFLMDDTLRKVTGMERRKSDSRSVESGYYAFQGLKDNENLMSEPAVK